MSFYEWRAYVSVAERRRQAERELAKLQEEGTIRSRPSRSKAARSPRPSGASPGATISSATATMPTACRAAAPYVRNGSVIDLQIAKGEVEGDGQRLRALPSQDHYRAGAASRMAGHLPRLRRLDRFAGRAPAGAPRQGVMDRVCREGDGLFPAPKEIKLSCSCPDWADMCKHVAAVLYGIGARLDQ